MVRKHNKPRPRVAHRGIARFLGNDQKCNQVITWSLCTFPENFMQIRPASVVLHLLLHNNIYCCTIYTGLVQVGLLCGALSPWA